VATRKPEKAAAEARRKARRDAQREGYQVSKETLEAADWVILLTPPPDAFSTQDVSKDRQVSTNVPPDLTSWFIFHHSFARAARERTRGLSPHARRRLTRPGDWRVLKQLVAILIQAVIPQPDLARLRRCHAMLARNIYEPPRKRCYQKRSRAF
jgi:hypothetical protein